MRFRTNPAHLIDPVYLEIVRLWLAGRGDYGGMAHLPEKGALLDQPAWLMEAFAIISDKISYFGSPNTTSPSPGKRSYGTASR